VNRTFTLLLAALILGNVALGTMALLDPGAPPGSREDLWITWTLGGLAVALLVRAWLAIGEPGGTPPAARPRGAARP
jgi:hypothetical protein